jgi:transcriptional regulator with XRE-family HTH domain
MEIETKYEPSPEGAVLRRLRQAADLPQTEVSLLLGLPRGSWASMELGLIRPKPETIRAFCAAFDLPRSMEERLLSLRATEWTQPRRRTRSKKDKVTIGKPNISKRMSRAKSTVEQSPDAA